MSEKRVSDVRPKTTVVKRKGMAGIRGANGYVDKPPIRKRKKR